jgi:hypothetical protein
LIVFNFLFLVAIVGADNESFTISSFMDLSLLFQ